MTTYELFNEITAFLQKIAFWETLCLKFCRYFLSLQKRSYISFPDAIKCVAETKYYHKLNKMWEGMGITQESYNEGQLLKAMESNEIPFYGCKVFSKRTKLQKIDPNILNQNVSRNEFRTEDSSIISPLKEILYSNISFKRSDLNKLIKKIKKDMSN